MQTSQDELSAETPSAMVVSRGEIGLHPRRPPAEQILEEAHGMDWGQLLTAGVTSAVLSSAVSLATAIATFRYNRRKDVHALQSTRLETLREAVRKVDYVDTSVLFHDFSESELGDLVGAQMQITTDAYNKCVDLFEQNRFSFKPTQTQVLDDIIHRFDTLRLKVIELRKIPLTN